MEIMTGRMTLVLMKGSSKDNAGGNTQEDLFVKPLLDGSAVTGSEVLHGHAADVPLLDELAHLGLHLLHLVLERVHLGLQLAHLLGRGSERGMSSFG